MGNRKKELLKKFFDTSGFADNLADRINTTDLSSGFEHFGNKITSNFLFLGRYDADNIKKIIVKSGLWHFLLNKGFKELIVRIKGDSTRVNYLEIYNQKESADNLLVDLRLSETRYITDLDHSSNKSYESYDSIVIEWLLAQNPYKEKFSKERPQLPGQKKPGLGCLVYLMKMMYLVTRQITKDAFLDIPDHAHLAIIYSKKFLFFNPLKEAQLRALLRDLKDYSIEDIAWGIITKSIINRKNGEKYFYEPSPQMFPVSWRMKRYFKSSKYLGTFREELKNYNFFLDKSTMNEEKNKILKLNKIEDL